MRKSAEVRYKAAIRRREDMSEKPNIVFIFSDQQRADTITPEVTPNLLELAKEGANYTNVYTCQPVCGPARACLQTGMYATKNGCIENGIPMRETDTHLADLFNGAGYDTAYIGKWHLASKGLQYRKKGVPQNLRGGYKYWLAADLLEFSSTGSGGRLWDNDCNEVRFEGVRADKMTDFALDYLRMEHDKPFFLFLSFLEPHHQNTSFRFECPPGYDEQFKDYPIPVDLKGLRGNYNRNYADYLGCCKSLDENVKRIVDELKAQGKYDNTLIIYTSDHGCHFMTRNMEYKRSCHEGSTHIPLIMAGGAFRDDGDKHRLISLIDLPPTMLAAAGIAVPSNFDGVPMQSGAERDCVFAQISESHNGRCVITKDYTYSISSGHNYSTDVYKDDYLYNRSKDKGERHNLINCPSAVKEKEHLRELLVREMTKAGENAPTIRRRLFKGNI